MAERFDFETVNFTGHAPSRKNVIRVAVVIAALLLLVFFLHSAPLRPGSAACT